MTEEEKRIHAGLGILRDAYLANDLRIIEPSLAEDCEYSSFFATDDKRSKEGVLEVLKERFARSIDSNGKYFKNAILRMPAWQFGPFQSYYPESEVIIGFGDEKDPRVMAKINVDLQGRINKIRILPSDFYGWEFVAEDDQYDFDELYTFALDEASAWMQAKGCLELFRERQRLSYPNLVVFDEGKPVEIAVIPVRFPFVGSISSSYREKIARTMSPDLKQHTVFVQYKNLMDKEKPWDLKRGSELICTLRDEPSEIEYIDMEVNENEFEA